jgi:hypothetical protein
MGRPLLTANAMILSVLLTNRAAAAFAKTASIMLRLPNSVHHEKKKKFFSLYENDGSHHHSAWVLCCILKGERKLPQ